MYILTTDWWELIFLILPLLVLSLVGVCVYMSDSSEDILSEAQPFGSRWLIP